jgi:hypothetical protein
LSLGNRMPLENFADWLLGGVTAAALWVWRSVILHDKKLDLIEREHKHATEHRKAQDENINSLVKDQKAILNGLTELRILHAKTSNKNN